MQLFTSIVENYITCYYFFFNFILVSPYSMSFLTLYNKEHILSHQISTFEMRYQSSCKMLQLLLNMSFLVLKTIQFLRNDKL